MTTDQSATDTAMQDTTPVDNPDSGQSEQVNAGTGTTQVENSTGAAAATSTTDTSSASQQMTIDDVGKRIAERQGLPQNTNPATTQPPPSWEDIRQQLGISSPDDLKRIANERSLMGRHAQELGTLRKNYATLEAQIAQQRQAQEAEAAKASLSPFHAKHPQFQNNQQRVTRANGFLSALQALPPEMQNDQNQVNRLAQQMGVSKQDVDLAHQAREYREQTQQQLASDPEGFIESRAQRVVSQALQQFESYLNNRTQAQSFVQQHQDLIQDPKTQQIMANALDESVSRSQLAVQLAQMTRERDALLSKVDRETAALEMARAQQELSGRQVTTRRRASTSTTTQVDPWERYNEVAAKDPKADEGLLSKLLESRFKG